MKKMLSLILVGTMILALVAGCGAKPETATGPAKQTEANVAETTKETTKETQTGN